MYVYVYVYVCMYMYISIYHDQPAQAVYLVLSGGLIH
jgi:hypothetical protein